MKIGTLLIFLYVGFLSCSQEKDAGLSGRYIGTQNFGLGQVGSAIVINVSQQNMTLTGTITPPFQLQGQTILNGTAASGRFQFDTTFGNHTYHYDGMAEGTTLIGSFGPLACVTPASSEMCPTDSNGTFTATKQ